MLNSNTQILKSDNITIPFDLLTYLTKSTNFTSNIIFSPKSVSSDVSPLLEQNQMFNWMALYSFKDVNADSSKSKMYADNYLMELLVLDKDDFATFVNSGTVEKKTSPTILNKYLESFNDKSWDNYKLEFIKKIAETPILDLLTKLSAETAGNPLNIKNGIKSFLPEDLYYTLTDLQETINPTLDDLDNIKTKRLLINTTWKTGKNNLPEKRRVTDAAIGMGEGTERYNVPNLTDIKGKNEEYDFISQLTTQSPILYDLIMDFITVDESKIVDPTESAPPELIDAESNYIVTFNSAKYFEALMDRFGFGTLDDSQLTITKTSDKTINEAKKDKNKPSQQGRPLVYLELLHKPNSDKKNEYSWTHIKFVNFNEEREFSRNELDKLILLTKDIPVNAKNKLKEELEKVLTTQQDNYYEFSDLILDLTVPASEGITVGESEFQIKFFDMIDDENELLNILDSLENPERYADIDEKGEKTYPDSPQLDNEYEKINKKIIPLRKQIKEFEDLKDFKLDFETTEKHEYNLIAKTGRENSERPSGDIKIKNEDLFPSIQILLNDIPEKYKKLLDTYDVKNNNTNDEFKAFYSKEFLKEFEEAIVRNLPTKKVAPNEWIDDETYDFSIKIKNNKVKTKIPTILFEYTLSSNYDLKPLDLFKNIIDSKNAKEMRSQLESTLKDLNLYIEEIPSIKKYEKNKDQLKMLITKFKKIGGKDGKSFSDKYMLYDVLNTLESNPKNPTEDIKRTKDVLIGAKTSGKLSNLTNQTVFSFMEKTDSMDVTEKYDYFRRMAFDKNYLKDKGQKSSSSRLRTSRDESETFMAGDARRRGKSILPLIEEVKHTFTASHKISPRTTGISYANTKGTGLVRKPNDKEVSRKRGYISTVISEDKKPSKKSLVIEKIINRIQSNFKYMKQRST